jgi:hypothetical protein
LLQFILFSDDDVVVFTVVFPVDTQSSLFDVVIFVVILVVVLNVVVRFDLLFWAILIAGAISIAAVGYDVYYICCCISLLIAVWHFLVGNGENNVQSLSSMGFCRFFEN